MTYRELTRRLKRCGCQFARQGRGDHEIWVNDKTQTTTTIPNWGSRDLKPGTVGAILRDLGISRDEFNRV